MKKSYLSVMQTGKKPRVSFINSISFRLTLYFAVFGLIIGYSVFLTSTLVEGNRYLDIANRMITEQLGSLNFDLNDTDVEAIRELLKNVSGRHEEGTAPLHDLRIYIRSGSEESWTVYKLSKDGDFFAGESLSENDALLERASERGSAFSNFFFFGRTDLTTAYLRIPYKTTDEIIIAATISRQGLAVVLKSRQAEIVSFSLVLLMFSFILGKAFASRMTSPIRSLALKADRIAQGQKGVRLSLRRKDEIGVLSRSIATMEDNLMERLKAMEIMNQIDKAVLSSVSRSDLINRVVGFVSSYIDKSTAVMAVRKQNAGGFELISASSASNRKIMIKNPFIPDELLTDRTFKTLQSCGCLIEDGNLTEVIKKQLELPSRIKTFYNVPIRIKENYLGSLCIIKTDNSPLTEEEQQTLLKLGDQVGVAMQSVIAVEELDNLQMGSIRALSSAVDAKSRWTAGHSERVAIMSEKIGLRMGLDESEMRKLVISALLHDIGKIGVSEAILDKPGKLTDEEFRIIQSHTVTGFEILASMPDFDEICEGIKYHHERLNGRGYPEGLSGSDIPLFARIIAVADVYDAMTEDRPYRKGLSTDETVAFILEKKGTEFDPQSVDAFIETLNNDAPDVFI